MPLKSLLPTRQGLMALGVIAGLFVLFLLRGASFALDPVRTANAPGQFDAGDAIGRLTRIIGDGVPHPVDGPALDAVRGRLLGEIEALGYKPEVLTHDACRQVGPIVRCARVSNIMFAAGPQSGKAIVLTAHYDSVDISPGAGDDGIGLAVWLETARIFAQAQPSRRIVFLFTDGEETALLGAQAFADAKDYDVDIGRIINLEARGDRGPAMMFETSHPNAGVVGDWARGASRPVSNSLMTAVYELLPNSTDLTVHLRNNRAGINMAVGDGFAFYHTEKDDLAHLDPRSVQHMGDQALAAARSFAASAPSGGEIVYADILSRVFVSLPVVFALILLGLCLGLAAILMAKPTAQANLRVFDWRAFAAGPVVVIVSAALVWIEQFVLGLARIEPAFWTAHPDYFHAAIFLTAALAAAAALAFVAPKSSRASLFASGWLWLMTVGVGLSFAVPGAAMIFLVPGAAFVAAGVAARLAPRRALIAHAVAAAVALAMILPIVHLLDTMMGLAIAPVFGGLAALALLPALPLIGPLTENKRQTLAMLGASVVLALLVTLLAPAYSRETPLSLDVYAHYDVDARKAAVAASAPAGALPKEMRAVLPEKPAPVLVGYAAPFAHAALAFRNWPNPRADIISDTTADGVRRVKLRLVNAAQSGPAARFIRIRIPEAANPVSLVYGPSGRTFPLTTAQAGYHLFDCYGRACDGADLTIDLKPGGASPDWIVQGFITGLPDDAKPIAALRPDWAIQIGTGDATVVSRRLALR